MIHMLEASRKDTPISGPQYWAFEGGGWYVGPSWNGPWAVVGPAYVPAPILQVPVGYYRVPPAHWGGNGVARRRRGGRGTTARVARRGPRSGLARPRGSPASARRARLPAGTLRSRADVNVRSSPPRMPHGSDIDFHGLHDRETLRSEPARSRSLRRRALAASSSKWREPAT